MAKRLLAICLSLALVLCGCSQSEMVTESSSKESTDIELTDTGKEEIPEDEIGNPEEFQYEPNFENLDDEELIRYIEDDVYSNLVNELNDTGYYVENVNAIFVSKEYLEETAYNSQANIFFGYTLEDIEAVYKDSKYVFTTNDEGKTIVTAFEKYDDTYEQIIKNVAIGSGVILLCVTVSVVTGGAGLPAVSMVFAMSAKTGTIMALSSAGIGGLAAGITTHLQTGDIDKALKSAALESSEQFKWGAILGTISGGAVGTAKYAAAMKALEGVELSIPIQEAAAIQMESGYPASVIAQFHSMEEYEVFKAAGLEAEMVNGQIALVRDIDLTTVDTWGRTNLERMKLGLAALDKTGKSYELHHIGQGADATLAVLTSVEHDSSVLHGFVEVSQIDRVAFSVTREQFWKTMAIIMESGGL
ncbi:A nuclease of the HNH/ENDO VII superfamily with conserved LHH [Pseudobutyrivibrio sp. YE44]|uniref:HNH/ENDO VII family nuclease n=1 Tax=Pseudobutyrivibrio sp. YE44 TaxID=1520802 RepID=UPI000885BD28|nr:HNH/ENDO VII family nuclease [Pseudobutyrivibrio sp. YE44]SDB44863.1 A nuclease of the HNH/ENDO VII superfamily with conserved LHH [Pseudobutyrivibrio sp. YE44]